MPGKSGPLQHDRTIECWRLGPDRVREWRGIRLESLRDAPEAFDARLEDWRDRPLSDFAARLETVPTFAVGAEIGRPLAVASWQAGLDTGDPSRGWLLSVFARPEARGHGYAEAAIRAVQRDAFAAGMRSIGLYVVAGNCHAQTLYRRLGFTETGREGIVNAHGFPEIEMIGMLNSSQ